MEGCSSALPARWQPQKVLQALWNRGWFSVICQVLLLLSTVLSLCPVQFEQVWNEGYWQWLMPPCQEKGN